jgi:hypothetical protein
MIKKWIKSLTKKVKALWFQIKHRKKYIEDTHIYED